MKFSYLSDNRYLGDAAYVEEAWPSPPAAFDVKVGQESLRVALELATLADDLGYDWVSCSEHHYTALLQTPNVAVYAAALCGAVKRAKIALLGPLVAMNNPIRLAEEVAQLDQLSGGRLIVLPLRGSPNEFLSYGVNPDETRAITEEAVLLMVRSLRESNAFGWQGRHFKFRTIAVWPRPVQEDVPFYYSGNSKESVIFAAENGFGLAISFFPTHIVSQMTALYRQECERHGWQPAPEQTTYRAFVAVGETSSEAQKLEAKYFGNAPIEALFKGRGAALAGPKQAQAGFGLGKLQFCGTVDEVVEQIREFHEQTGIGVIDCAFSGAGLSLDETKRSMSLFAEQVIPSIRMLGEIDTMSPKRGQSARSIAHAA